MEASRPVTRGCSSPWRDGVMTLLPFLRDPGKYEMAPQEQSSLIHFLVYFLQAETGLNPRVLLGSDSTHSAHFRLGWTFSREAELTGEGLAGSGLAWAAETEGE